MRELALTTPLAAGDGDAVATLVARCIAECCLLDHGGRPAVIAAWSDSFRPGRVRSLLAERGCYGLGITADSALMGAGILSRAGVLRLLFIEPDRQRLGLGRRLLTAIEFEARRRWVSALSVDATASAVPFFTALGFDATGGEPVDLCGVALTPMWKPLPR